MSSKKTKTTNPAAKAAKRAAKKAGKKAALPSTGEEKVPVPAEFHSTHKALLDSLGIVKPAGYSAGQFPVWRDNVGELTHLVRTRDEALLSASPMSCFNLQAVWSDLDEASRNNIWLYVDELLHSARLSLKGQPARRIVVAPPGGVAPRRSVASAASVLAAAAKLDSAIALVCSSDIIVAAIPADLREEGSVVAFAATVKRLAARLPKFKPIVEDVSDEELRDITEAIGVGVRSLLDSGSIGPLAAQVSAHVPGIPAGIVELMVPTFESYLERHFPPM